MQLKNQLEKLVNLKGKQKDIEKDLKMQKKHLGKVALLIQLFLATGCASTQSVDMKRFSEAQKLMNRLPEPPACSVTPMTMHEVTKPIDTSGGVFVSLSDVAKQDSSASSHYPIVVTKFDTLSRTVIINQKIDKENRRDYVDSIIEIRDILNKVVDEEKEGSRWNPFD